MIKIIVPGFGAGKYQVAAWCSQKRLIQILDSPNSNANLIHYEMASPKTGGINETDFFRYKGDWFLHKLKIWEKVLSNSNEEFYLHIDADASATTSFSLQSLLIALGDKSIGMVQQPRVLGNNPLGKKELYEHYLRVSHKAVNSGAPKSTLETFIYFNSGFVLFRRSALKNFLQWAAGIMVDMPREIDGQMVADQDILQVYANEIVPEVIADLGWQWNHCQWWDADFPNPEAHIIHMSNFCQGPTATQMNRLAVLSRGNQAENFIDLTVLMVSHNSGEILQNSLDALLEIPGLSILVVDNNSTQAPEATMNSRLQVMVNDTNLGYGAAVNIGLSQVKTEYVCLLNPDALLTYEATAEAMEKLREDANQLLAPNFFDSTGNFTASLRSGYPLSRLIEDLIPSPKNISRKIVSKVLGERVGSDFPWLIGACVFSSTKFLVDIGGLDQSYFLYMEDVELGRQACKKGLVQSLESPIEHYGRQSTDKSEIFIATELSKARLKYLRRHFGFWPWVLIVFVHKLNTYYNHLLKS
jgi:GT2 family glycosyltransferase